jgi:ribosomal protein S12 methylthiotransferase accessory factor
MGSLGYRLAPGLEIVRLDRERFLLRSDFVAFGLSGEAAVELVEHVLGDLGQPLTLDEVAARLPAYRRESLYSQLEELVGQGVLVRGGGEDLGAVSPYAVLFDEIGLGAAPTLARLAASKVGIMGLEAHGAHVAQMLADAGVGELVLVDPFAFEHGHLLLTPVSNPDAVGLPRELAVAVHVGREGVATRTSGVQALDREAVAAVTEGCDAVVVCWDRGLGAAAHWSNEAAIRHGVRTLFSELRPTSSVAGPLFVPDRSACWMCYRMRSLACERDFDLAMSLEEHFDAKRHPSLAQRGVLPVLPAQLAATLALETLKLLIRVHQPRLVDRIVEFDAITSVSQAHSVLVKPLCPTCAKKKTRIHPSATELVKAAGRDATALHELTDQLVSPRTGMIAEFAVASRDATEPPQPQVWHARLANHCFASEIDETHLSCSGKGMTREQAWTSCLGEAVERYSGGCWDPDEVVSCRRRDLPGRSIDPRELVLYRSEQYANLPYAPYDSESVLRWVRGRSLVHDDEVWLPAIAVFMEFQVQSEEEFLFPVTSNGLAAGPTLGDAVLSAVCEVLERDAVMIAWLARLPGTRLDPRRHPDADVRRLARGYRRRGVELVLYQVPTDHPVSVIMAIAFQDGGHGGPCATVGLGASIDQVAAARSAVLEVGQVRPAFRARARTHDAQRIAELVADPMLTESLEDHALLYADPAMRSAFAFLNGPWGTWAAPRAPGMEEALSELIAHFRASGGDMLYVNLTPQDLEPLGLFSVRAVVPGFQPIWFGRRERRLGGRRLFELPHRLGLRPAPLDVASLNPLPHPVA